MQIGTKVIRKRDITPAVTIFGIVESILGKKACIRWLDNGRQQHSTLNITALAIVTPEIEQDIRARAQARHDEQKRKWDEAHKWVCMNINPRARISNEGHHKPMLLAKEGVVDGTCWYCGAAVQEREQTQ